MVRNILVLLICAFFTTGLSWAQYGPPGDDIAVRLIENRAPCDFGNPGESAIELVNEHATTAYRVEITATSVAADATVCTNGNPTCEVSWTLARIIHEGRSEATMKPGSWSGEAWSRATTAGGSRDMPATLA